MDKRKYTIEDIEKKANEIFEDPETASSVVHVLRKQIKNKPMRYDTYRAIVGRMQYYGKKELKDIMKEGKKLAKKHGYETEI